MTDRDDRLQPCVICRWPVPDEQCAICPCCGHEPIADGAVYAWDGQWWAKPLADGVDRRPLILQRFEVEVAALQQERDHLRQQITTLVERWRAEGQQIDTFHATMGTGWKQCAEDLAAALTLSAS